VSKARDALAAAVVLLLGRGRHKPRKDARRIVPKEAPNPRAETWAILLLLFSCVCAVGFILAYAFESWPSSTQLLGLSLGLCLLSIAAALIVVAKKVIVTEELAEPYSPEVHPHEQELIAQVVEESGDRFTRKRLFKGALAAAGGTLGLAAITPALSFGPFFQTKYFLGTPWRRGRRLVDDKGKPYKASDIEQDDFYLAFPEAIPEQDKEMLSASLVLVRLPVSSLRLPGNLRGYDADGIVAYSRICTHAGCAISLYRAPLFQPDEPRPALVCPCHYSTFDPATGGTVMFGPAGRPLPMLPLKIDRQGYLRANGNFDQQAGPSWWGVREWKPDPQ
jgi:ubiquinol-cytochrome c reductase iron-sulfur subunit